MHLFTKLAIRRELTKIQANLSKMNDAVHAANDYAKKLEEAEFFIAQLIVYVQAIEECLKIIIKDQNALFEIRRSIDPLYEQKDIDMGKGMLGELISGIEDAFGKIELVKTLKELNKHRRQSVHNLLSLKKDVNTYEVEVGEYLESGSFKRMLALVIQLHEEVNRDILDILDNTEEYKNYQDTIEKTQ